MTTQTEIKKPDETIEVKIESLTLSTIDNANDLCSKAESLKILNNEHYQNSGEFLKKIKTATKNLVKARKEITKPIDSCKKNVMSFFNDPVDRLNNAESMIKRAMINFQDEQERAAREAQRKAELKAREEEEKRQAAIMKRAKKAEEDGKYTRADSLKEAAEEVYVAPKPVSPTIEKVKGISTKSVWKYRVIREIDIPKEYLIPDDKLLSNVAKATKGMLSIPGIQFYEEKVMSSRGV